jgi:hypothetical protein
MNINDSDEKHRRWKELFRNFINDPTVDKEAIAKQLRVTVRTINRYAQLPGPTPKGYELITNLATIIPGKEPEMTAALKVAFPQVFGVTDTRESVYRTLAPHVFEALNLLATTERRYAPWAIISLTFQQLVRQLEREGVGFFVTYIKCQADEDGIVRTLYCDANESLGSGPWKERPIHHSFFLGDETLSANAIMSLQPTFYPGEYMLSFDDHVKDALLIKASAAFPVMRYGFVSGVLFLASDDFEFFHYDLRTILRYFALILGLVPYEADFFPVEKIELRLLEKLSYTDRETIYNYQQFTQELQKRHPGKTHEELQEVANNVFHEYTKDIQE